MFTRWLPFIAFLTGSVTPGSSVTFPSTCRVKGEPLQEMILACGDGKHQGVVQFWHTPFGDLQSSGSRSHLDPVFMDHDGNLVIPNSSVQHSGLYYCVRRHRQGSTLWPYELHVGPGSMEDGQRGNGCAARRFRRNAGFPAEREAVVSDRIFAGAVAASVLLTFVVGFSAGALSRTPVLRCLQAVSMRLSPKQRRRQPDVPDDSGLTMTTRPPVDDARTFEKAPTRQVSPARRTSEAPAPLTTPSPPAKPKRSFRHKDKAEPEGAAYLEGCDYNRVEKEGGGDGEAKEEEETRLSFYSLEGEGSETEDRQVEDGEASKEKADAAGEHSSGEEEEEEASEEEDGGPKTVECKELEHAPPETDDERSIKNERDTTEEETADEAASCSPRRRSRVIRLYQYNEDGQMYGHLPDPAPEPPEPAPRLKQRSLSLTRLNAIMAAASAGPMERAESGKEQGEEKPRFHMEI
ncbi:uncharacterized protein V3H82_003457 [Fundulus diaphanus]